MSTILEEPTCNGFWWACLDEEHDEWSVVEVFLDGTAPYSGIQKAFYRIFSERTYDVGDCRKWIGPISVPKIL